MALINDKHKFIFFHLYKCGGNSLRKPLNDLCKGSIELQGVHGLPLDLKKYFDSPKTNQEFENFFKFTFIRNPFDFMVSTYFYGKTYTNHFMHKEIVDRNMTMKEFIPYYMNVRIQHTKTRPVGSNKVVTFKDWLHDEKGNEIMDFVGKLETINEDSKIIFDKLGLPASDVPVVNVNQTRSKDYREYYTDESRAMIEKHFAWELDKFNYKF